MSCAELKILLILIAAVHCTYADYYSANSGLEVLLDIESFMVENLESFIKEEKERTESLRNFIDFMQHEIAKMKNDSDAYFGNPLNAWKAIKRTTREWRDFYYAEIHNKNPAAEYVEEIATYFNETGMKKPELDDLIGAAKGIVRLQRTYNLETSHLANGTIMGQKLSPEMTAADCFDLGMGLKNATDYKNSATWLLEARVRLVRETQAAAKLDLFNFPYISDSMILQNLVPVVMQNGNYNLALWLIQEQLAKDPGNPIAIQNNRVIEERLKREHLNIESGVSKHAVKKPLTLTEMYEKTCSGELTQTPREKRKLRCRYVNNNVPFCLIAPFKMEELNLDPYVAFYHEFVYESEIEKILEAAEDNVERSKVGSGSESEVRTSKNAWLWHHQHAFLKPISQRLFDITRLSLNSAEPLQVANYGIGGHYGPHYDFSEDKNFDYNGRGNRILTAMFYINDVELGGATAFPFLRLAITPIRRSLVIWYNMHRSLEFDYRTRHGGCPVLKGSKWICNEWLHTRGQEFFRPCGLKPDGYLSASFQNMTVMK